MPKARLIGQVARWFTLKCRQTYLIKLPIMVGTIGSDKSPSNSSSSSAPPSNDNSTAQAKRLQVALTTPNGERLGDIAIDPDNMVDIALTQRLS